MNRHSLEYYRVPPEFTEYQMPEALPQQRSFFKWDDCTMCYGRAAVDAKRAPMPSIGTSAEDSEVKEGIPSFPFNAEEVIENLQRERYSAHFREPGRLTHALLRKAYYLVRPWLSVGARVQLQRMHLRNWEKIPFPEWPVDTTVDRIHRKLLKHAMQARGVDKVPFIWFWPDGYTCCTIITHDVESAGGKKECARLMDVDESFGFRSSFQIVPEDRYAVTRSFLQSITERGFEVNVHDLKHDGRLYADFKEFLRRARLINQYGQEFGARGFRSGILYRNADWYDAFEFDYDMSLPNVAHLDPQHGGCCTVLPFFIGRMVELPLTCTQDYTLFHIMKSYSIDLWKTQISLIRENVGLVTILVHPDYLTKERARSVYKQLLAYLAELRDSDHMWTPLPRDVAFWWRQRSQMKLVQRGGNWEIEGPGHDRARIGYACLENDQLVYRCAIDERR